MHIYTDACIHTHTGPGSSQILIRRVLRAYTSSYPPLSPYNHSFASIASSICRHLSNYSARTCADFCQHFRGTLLYDVADQMKLRLKQRYDVLNAQYALREQVMKATSLTRFTAHTKQNHPLYSLLGRCASLRVWVCAGSHRWRS